MRNLFQALAALLLVSLGCSAEKPLSQPQAAKEPNVTKPAPKDNRGNLCWWNFEANGLHPTGSNFTAAEMCDVAAEFGLRHDIPGKANWGTIHARGQQIDCTMCEWSDSLAGAPPFGPSIGDEDPMRRAEIVRQMKIWMEIAQENNVPKMLCFLGNNSGDDRAKQWERVDASLKELTAHAEELGSLQLCFEPLNDVDFGSIPLANMKGHPGQFCPDPLEMLKHLKRVGKPKVCGMAFDFYHPAAEFRKQWIVGENVEESRKSVTNRLLDMFDQCGEYVLHTHTAQITLDDERMRGELHLVGGLIDYDVVYQHVWQSGYEGRWLAEWVTTEGATEDIGPRRTIIRSGIGKATKICGPK